MEHCIFKNLHLYSPAFPKPQLQAWQDPGVPWTLVYEGDLQIPVLAKLRALLILSGHIVIKERWNLVRDMINLSPKSIH